MTLTCLHRPQAYRSLKEVDLLQGDEAACGAEVHTAPPSPVGERFSNVTLLGGVFSCQDEPDNQSLTLTKSLEDLRTAKDSEEPQVKLICQVRGPNAVVDLMMFRWSQTWRCDHMKGWVAELDCMTLFWFIVVVRLPHHGETW